MNLLLLNDIRLGRTRVDSGFWIKHPSIDEECHLEELTAKFLVLATKRKIPREKDAIALAEQRGEWTSVEERDLESSEAYLSRLKESYEKVMSEQKKYLQEDLDTYGLKIYNLSNKKKKAIGKTAEAWASKLAYERYILNLFYKDSHLKEPVWNSEDIEFVEDEVLEDVYFDFSSYRAKTEEDKLKDLACTGFCQNLYSVAGGATNFLGKKLLDMTCLQQNFCFFLENYKNIRSGITGKVPQSVLSDWRELDKWAYSSERGREEMEKNWSGPKGNSKINFENIKKASMSQNKEAEAKNLLNMLS